LTFERILVTGASGLVGTRLCEHLRIARGLTVRGTIHDARRAIRVARLDVELVRAYLGDPASLERALDGCDAVVHCAYGTSGTAKARRALTGSATGTLAELARRAGVRRFVHLSSVAVWGFSPRRRELDESVPAAPAGHPYVDGKIDAEAGVAAAHARGLATVVLRPTNVFGPWAPAFTVAPVEAMRAGAVALVGEGAGPANHVYVDNVVHAIERALVSDESIGGTFVVSDPDGVSWRELYEAYAGTASPPWEVRSISADDYRRARGRPGARALVMAAGEHPALRSVGRRVAGVVPGVRSGVRRVASGGGGPALPSEELAAIQTSGVSFRLDRARETLGYDPPVAFDEAIELTRAWLRFARLA
jgi:nucleoside-diphosphate-sugar epimerase